MPLRLRRILLVLQLVFGNKEKNLAEYGPLQVMYACAKVQFTCGLVLFACVLVMFGCLVLQ